MKVPTVHTCMIASRVYIIHTCTHVLTYSLPLSPSFPSLVMHGTATFYYNFNLKQVEQVIYIHLCLLLTLPYQVLVTAISQLCLT